MNRRANEAIVCFDCNHGLEFRFWVLRRRAPYYKGANLRICVENPGFPEDAKNVNAYIDKNNSNSKKPD